MKRNIRPTTWLLSALLLALSWLAFGCQSPVPSNEFSGTIGGVPFKFTARKQTVTKGVALKVTTVSGFATNYAELSIAELSSKNDPQVISKSYAGQAAVAREFFQGINNFAGKLTEGGVKGLKGGASIDSPEWTAPRIALDR